MNPRAAKAALRRAALVQASVNQAGLGPPPRRPGDPFDTLVTDSGLRGAVSRLYRDGHYSQAVQEAFKYLNNVVKERSGLTADGDSLMRTAFSANNPRLRLNPLRSVSEKDEQRGYMDLLAGAMTGIRNPRAHEHDWRDDPGRSLELLIFANHLVTLAKSARKVSQRRSRSAVTKQGPSLQAAAAQQAVEASHAI